MEERRQARRRRTLLTGRISFPDASVECVVRDLSDEGARVRCDPRAVLPETFSLAIEKLGEERSARPVWRRESDIGLAFAARDKG